MKKPWDRVRFRVSHWDGQPPAPGDELRTARGRRYLILDFDGKRITVLVLPPDEPVVGRVFAWKWDSRKKQRA